MGAMQKKNWIGWSGKKAHELVVGWSNIIFAEGYKRIPDYPINSTPSIAGTQTQLIPGFNRSGQVLSIVGLSLTDAEQQRLSAMTPSQLTQWFKIRIPNSNIDISQLDAILCYSADKVVTILPGGFIRKGDREKINEVFLSEVSFTIKLDIVKMPTTFLGWAKKINEGKFNIKPKNLKYGCVFVAGRLGDTWGGMKIVKK